LVVWIFAVTINAQEEHWQLAWRLAAPQPTTQGPTVVPPVLLLLLLQVAGHGGTAALQQLLHKLT
jgi:hypothetical protein